MFWISLIFLGSLVPLEPAGPSEEELKDLHRIRGQIQGEIIFSSKRGLHWQIWKMNADGSRLHPLTEDLFDSRNCFWSPDYQKIYFNSDQTGKWQIYVMDELGKHHVNLSRSEKSEILWGITGDESKILFKTREDGEMAVFIRDMKTRKIHRVDFTDFSGRDGKIEPRISPDGRKMAFLFKNGKGAGRSIYVGDIDSEYHIRNVRPIHLGCFSAWAKDSSCLIMCVFTPGGTALHIASADGSSLFPITEGGRWNYFPGWSPDETWYVWSRSPTEFHDHDTGRYDIYIASLKDRTPIRLTFHDASDIDPSWRP